MLGIKQTTDRNLLYSSGNSVFCGDLNGMEVQKGGDVWILWWTHFSMQKLTQHCQATTYSGMLSHSIMSDSLRPPWTVAYQPSLTMGFSNQEYRSGLPFPTPEDRPDTGIEPYLLCLCLARGFCTTAPNNSYNSTGEKKETTQITQLKNGQWPGTDILPKKIYKWPASIEKVCNITSDQGNAN